MYRAKKDFKSYLKGDIKKGDSVDYNKAWLDAGLIEQVQGGKVETKPQPAKKTETKKNTSGKKK